MSGSLTLDHITLETLDTLLVSFDDLIVDRDIITGFELGKLDFSRQLLVHKSYSSVHNSIFLRIAKLYKNTQIQKFIWAAMPPNARLYLATLTALFSRITVTLIWPG